METHVIGLKKDLHLFCLEALSYPDGIANAHTAFRASLKGENNTIIYGLSRPEHQQIVYRVGAERSPAVNLATTSYQELVLKKGRYASIVIHNYAEHLHKIVLAFNELLKRTDIDENGYCIERYELDASVTCLVRLHD